MKRICAVIAMCLLAAVARAQSGEAKVTYLDRDAVAKGGTLVTASNLIVQVNTRTEAGQVEWHEKETDTFYVLSGAATVVTGGEMVDGKQTAPGQMRGTSITGGQTFHLTKGDVMIVPAKTPHWFKDVSGSVQYYVVKVVAP